MISTQVYMRRDTRIYKENLNKLVFFRFQSISIFDHLRKAMSLSWNDGIKIEEKCLMCIIEKCPNCLNRLKNILKEGISDIYFYLCECCDTKAKKFETTGLCPRCAKESIGSQAESNEIEFRNTKIRIGQHENGEE